MLPGAQVFAWAVEEWLDPVRPYILERASVSGRREAARRAPIQPTPARPVRKFRFVGGKLRYV